MKIVRVEYSCLGCQRFCSTTNHNLRYRQHNKNEHLCQKCLIRRQKASKVFDAVPSHLHHLLFKEHIEHSLAIEYLSGVSTSLKVKFNCSVCDTNCIINWDKLQIRKHKRLQDICNKCLQVSINNHPDAVKDNASRSKKLWRNTDYRSKCIKAFSDHCSKMQTDTEYAAKYKRRSKSISGTILVRDNLVRFDSAFELIFLHYISSRCMVVRRCEYAIAYDNHFYHPDFFIIDNDGFRSIVEIKGYYNNNVLIKAKAADRYVSETGVADAYVLYTTEKLLTERILDGVGGAHMWRQIKRIYDERIITFSEEKYRKIAEIGISRYRKEAQNSLNNQ